MVSVDLSFGTAAVENLMDDRCLIVHNPEGLDDGLLDNVTGQLDDLVPTDYRFQGACLIQDQSAKLIAEAGSDYQAGTARLLLPITALREERNDEPQVGDQLLVTAALRDPRLVGARYTITEIPLQTFAVARDCRMVRIG